MNALCWIGFAVAVFGGSALCLGVQALNAELTEISKLKQLAEALTGASGVDDDDEITPRNDPDTPDESDCI